MKEGIYKGYGDKKNRDVSQKLRKGLGNILEKLK